MATSFFNSWELWAKMSFVLGLAIITVFAIGYGKLVWRNRLVRRQGSKDDEERIKNEELNQSGQMIEPRKSQDIPFGVRAIQSGVQVDGIWQSKGSTPIPASLRFSHVHNSSLNRSGSRSQSPSPRASLDTSRTAIQSTTNRGGASPRSTALVIVPLVPARAEGPKAAEVQDMRGSRPSYKPRRSSHLRYGSYGETKHNEDLDHLEDSAVPKPECSQRPSGTQEIEVEGDASSGAVADNERSSGSETDATMSYNFRVHPRSDRQSLPVPSSGGIFLPDPIKTALSRSPRASLPSHSSDAEYFAVPLEPPEHEQPDPFVSPPPSFIKVPLPTFRPPYAQTARELTASGESQVPLLSRSQSPFIPGELHMNKTVRKVNSGFEVQPAGTFGVPTDIKGKGVGHEDRWNQDYETGEKRYSNKLQKKIRTSISSRRPSTSFESP